MGDTDKKLNIAEMLFGAERIEQVENALCEARNEVYAEGDVLAIVLQRHQKAIAAYNKMLADAKALGVVSGVRFMPIEPIK